MINIFTLLLGIHSYDFKYYNKYLWKTKQEAT